MPFPVRTFSLRRALHAVTRDWVFRVELAGSSVSDASIAAHDVFIRGLESDGVLGKIRRLNTFSGQLLAAALTPIISTVGYSSDVNKGFVEGDYSETTAIKGNGTKYLLPGVRPRAFPVSNLSLWCWAADMETASSTAYLMGTFETGGPVYEMAAIRPGAFPRGAAQATNQATPREVFFSVLRDFGGFFGAASTGLSLFEVLWNGEREVSSAVAVSEPTAFVNREFSVWGRRTAGGAPQLPSTARIFVYAMGESLDRTESRALWRRVGNLMTALGRENVNTGDPVIMWGDSFSIPATALFLYEAFNHTRNVVGAGVGGETSTQIKTRFLADPETHGWTNVVWSGRINFGDPSTVLADIAEMVSNLTTNPKRFLVVSIFNGSTEGVGTANYNAIMALNAMLEAAYPDNYVDLRSYVVSQFDPGDPTDVLNHADDIPPSTLREDTLHLNDAGRAVAMDFLKGVLVLKGF
jgi:hypothetical protein